MFHLVQVEESRAEDLVAEYFSELGGGSKQQLQLLTERGMAAAVTSFVDRDDKHAIESIMKWVLWTILIILWTVIASICDL